MADKPVSPPLGQPLPKGSAAEELVGALLREFSAAEGARANFESHWDEVSKFVLPHYADSFTNKGHVTPGQKKGQDQFDTTANTALWRFGSAMESMITPGSGMWHKLRHPDMNVMRNRDVALWYDQVNAALFYYRYSPRSGFMPNQNDCYISIGAFGTSCMFVDAYKDPVNPSYRGLRYRNIHLGEVYFGANHQGQVDKVYRSYKMSWRQIMQKWGEDAIPQSHRDRARGKPDDEVDMLHVVKPNSSYDPYFVDSRGMRYASYYIIKDCKHLIERGGYRCMPYAVARYLTAPGEIYGRGPAMNVLPAIKVLNEQKKTLLKQGHRAVDPVLLAHDDGVLDGFSLKPGAINAGGVSADGKQLVHALPTGRVDIGEKMMQIEQASINDAFLVSLFQILMEPISGMTATEIIERSREKGALLSPTMGRFQHEAIGPMIEREFDLLMWQGLLPPPPPALVEAGAQYVVEFDSPLNRAMRSEEAAGVIRSMQVAAELAAQTQDPSVMDFFDLDAIIPEVTQIQGAPARFIRSAEQVGQIRQGRKQEQASQQLVQALPGIAAMAKAANPKGTSELPGQPSA